MNLTDDIGTPGPPSAAAGIAALLAAFLIQVADWIARLLPASVPEEVVAAGPGLVVALIGAGVGWLSQRYTFSRATHERDVLVNANHAPLDPEH